VANTVAGEGVEMSGAADGVKAAGCGSEDCWA